jgi:hypothetical protein
VTSRQLKRLLKVNGLSQRGAAKGLDLNERTMRRYVAGNQPIPLIVEYALRFLISEKIKP